MNRPLQFDGAGLLNSSLSRLSLEIRLTRSKGNLAMPLTRGMIIGYDVELMTLRFTMVDGSARIVDCAISGSALDQLSGEKRSAGPADRQIAFLKHRDAIEELASAQFDARAGARFISIEIFAKHILSLKNRARRCRKMS